MLRKTKTNEDRLRKQAKNIRQIEHTEMAEHEPSESAKRQVRHKPYQAAVLIREQGEQMRRETAWEYLQRRCGLRGDAGGDNKGTAEYIPE